MTNFSWTSRPPLVLLAERAEDAATFHSSTLCQHGLRVLVCQPSTLSLPIITEIQPDVLVLGLNPLDPVPSCWRAQHQRTPVIALSYDAADSIRAARLGCSALLIRPISISGLAYHIRCALGAAHAEGPAYSVPLWDPAVDTNAIIRPLLYTEHRAARKYSGLLRRHSVDLRRNSRRQRAEARTVSARIVSAARQFGALGRGPRRLTAGFAQHYK